MYLWTIGSLDHLLTSNSLKKYMRSVLDHKYLCKISEARNVKFKCENLHSLCKHHRVKLTTNGSEAVEVEWKNTMTWRRIKHSPKNIKHKVQHITEHCEHMLALESFSKKHFTRKCDILSPEMNSDAVNLSAIKQTTGQKGQICRVKEIRSCDLEIFSPLDLSDLFRLCCPLAHLPAVWDPFPAAEGASGHHSNPPVKNLQRSQCPCIALFGAEPLNVTTAGCFSPLLQCATRGVLVRESSWHNFYA